MWAKGRERVSNVEHGGERDAYVLHAYCYIVALRGLNCELGGSRIEPWFLRTSGHLQGRVFQHLVPLIPFKLRIPTLNCLRARTWGPRPRGTMSHTYKRRSGPSPLQEVGLARGEEVGRLDKPNLNQVNPT